jgi:hypothetical protein
LNDDPCWKSNKEKTRDCPCHDSEVVAAVPNEQLYVRATEHLGKRAKTLRYNELNAD